MAADFIKRKTLLLLGGSQQQVIAIEKAKECGYRTILCDYLPDNPGQYVADVFYQESTTDREKILDIAMKENIDGIVAYSSDPAAPTAAYVAEKLNLPTNSLQIVETLSNKHLFRDKLSEIGLPHPKSESFSADIPNEELENLCSRLTFPILIKPTDSSGSKGISRVASIEELPQAVEIALNHSRNNVLIAEEFIESSYPYIIGGDILVVDGKIVVWGLMDCIRDEQSSLIPVGKSYPASLDAESLSNLKQTLQLLVSALGIEFGELNVEVLIGPEGTPYVLELGSRAGGNMIPLQISDITGIDMVQANVMLAMGEKPKQFDNLDSSKDTLTSPTSQKYVTSYVLHSAENCIFEGVELSDLAQKSLYRKVIYKEPGDELYAFDGADKAVGILFFEFESEEQSKEFINNFKDHVKLISTAADSKAQ